MVIMIIIVSLPLPVTGHQEVILLHITTITALLIVPAALAAVALQEVEIVAVEAEADQAADNRTTYTLGAHMHAHSFKEGKGWLPKQKLNEENCLFPGCIFCGPACDSSNPGRRNQNFVDSSIRNGQATSYWWSNGLARWRDHFYLCESGRIRFL